MPRIRTIKQAVAEIKAIDPNSSITYHYIKSLVDQGLLPSMNAGTKTLIDLDSLVAYIATKLKS